MRAPAFSARGIWAILVALAILRVVSIFPRSMWLWGLNVPGFLSPAVAVGGLAVLAAALIPRVGRGCAPVGSALGDLLARAPRARLVAAAAAAALVWALPDRLWFLGDFMLRQGAIQGESNLGTIFQQALPIDLLVHGLAPRMLPTDPNTGSLFSRLLGGVESAVLALLAIRFARSQQLRGVALLASAGVVFFGGHLAFLTGFAKPAGELTLLLVATVVFGADFARHARSGFLLGVTVALAFGLHRSGLLLLPAWLLSYALWWRRHVGGRGRVGALVAGLLPAVMLVGVLPSIFRIVRSFDLPRHLATPEVAGAGGPLLAAFQPLHLLDLANLSLVLAPLGVWGLSWWASSSRRPSVELGLLGVTLLAALPLVLFVHPQQGLFRDWDVFAPVGAALCLLAALAVGTAMRDEPADWLAAPVLASAVVPTLMILLLHHDVDRGLERARALASESPGRTEREQSTLWDFIGSRAFRLARWDMAAEALSRAERFEPTRRLRLTWAIAETMRGNYAGAKALYSNLVTADPADPIAWLGLAGAAMRTGDRAAVTRASEKLDGFMRSEASAKEIRAYLAHFPQTLPADSSWSAAPR